MGEERGGQEGEEGEEREDQGQGEMEAEGSEDEEEEEETGSEAGGEEADGETPAANGSSWRSAIPSMPSAARCSPPPHHLRWLALAPLLAAMSERRDCERYLDVLD